VSVKKDSQKQTLLPIQQDTPQHVNFFEEIKVDTSQPAWVDEFGTTLKTLLSKGNKKIRTLSLFSGAGGLDIGFHDAGFDVVEMVEVESKFTKTLEANSEKGRLFEGSKACNIDVRKYTSEHLGEIDFIIGGPPCQTFSAAGRRAAGVKGIEDPRGMLFKEYERLLRELKPKAFLFENVYAIVGAQGGEPWKLIQQSFNEAGYKLHYRILDAADYGAPQHRERLIIVGVRDDKINFKFPAPTHGPDSRIGLDYYSAGQALADLPVDVQTGLGGQYGDLLGDIPPGLNYSFYTKKLGHPSPVFGWRSKFSDFLYKADPKMPVRAIKAQGGKYTGPFSWESRPFTVDELKRLQSFPDNYELVGSRGVAIHQIGNSVPPQFARMLAIAVANQVFEREIPFEIPLLEPGEKLNFRTRKRLLTDKYQQAAKEAIAKLNAPKVLPNIIGKHKPFYINSKLDISEEDNNGTKLFVNSVIADDSWKVTIFESGEQYEDSEVAMTTIITPVILHEWPFDFGRIELRLAKPELLNYLAGWKFIEMEIKECLGFADLVQFAGYYQYSPTINTETILSPELEDKTEWKLIKAISTNKLVGIERSIEDLASILNDKPALIEAALKSLKLHGYEIRSKNTNPQIKSDHYIIPYAFPTLTSRKVQFGKGL
jgi:DNA (cytosine-5)-methyltransferase 1